MTPTLIAQIAQVMATGRQIPRGSRDEYLQRIAEQLRIPASNIA